MSQVKVDEMTSFVGYKASKVAADDTVPCRSFATIKLEHISEVYHDSIFVHTSFLIY